MKNKNLLEQLTLKQLEQLNLLQKANNMSFEKAYFIVYYYNCDQQISNTINDIMKINQEQIIQHPYVQSSSLINQCLICSNGLHSIKHLQIQQENAQQIELILSDIRNIKYHECLICYQLCVTDQMLYIDDVNHEICIDCFLQHLKTEINEGNSQTLSCPHCKLAINRDIVKKYTDKIHYDIYDRQRQVQEVISNPLKRFCPNKKCSQVISLMKKNQTEATCMNCGTVVCTFCNNKLHLNVSCKQVQQSLIKELNLDGKQVKLCPNCQILVQKVSGCNQMTCKVCQYKFCWICLSTYTNFHYLPWNIFGCPGLSQSDAYNQSIDDSYNVKLILWRILMFILMILAIPIISALFVVISGPILFVKFAEQAINRIIDTKIEKRNKTTFCILILISLMLEPIFIIVIVMGLIISIIPGIVMSVYYYQKQKREQELQAQQNLSQRKGFFNQEYLQL